jgi:hypothetical protein
VKFFTLSENKCFCDDPVAACNFDRPLTFSKIAELSELCEPLYSKTHSRNSFASPLTFVVPAYQVVASISRFVE